MKQYLLAHDLGTSGNKATLFCTDGTLEKSRIVTYNTHYFNDTWVEQNADDWWQAVCRSTRELIAVTGIAPEQIKAVSFSGQMMGCLCVDRYGQPLRPSIIWADQRAVSQSKAVESKISQKDYYQIVGHPNTASYGIQKLMWIRDHEPEIYNQTYKILNAKDYIVFQLTSTFCTDYSDANSCGFFDIKTFSWSEKLLSYAEIPIDKLPDPKPSTFCAGGVTAKAALLTGLSAGTPVIIGAGTVLPPMWVPVLFRLERHFAVWELPHGSPLLQTPPCMMSKCAQSPGHIWFRVCMPLMEQCSMPEDPTAG